MAIFVNREAELADLEERYRSARAEMYVLYGRRRVGKTELLRTFCHGKPHVFFIATLSSDRDQLASFSQAVWQVTHADALEGFTYPTWEAAFLALADLPGRPIVVLDEFTYLTEGNKSLPSVLQKVWDAVLRQSHIFLVLCGSYVGMIERDVLNYQAPLYGRRTGSCWLSPLELPAAATLFPAYAAVQQIETWAVLGGMPYYLSVFSDQVDVFANIRRHILDAQGILYREPQLLLMEELREPRNYFSILRAIAHGKTRLNEIRQAAGVGDASTTARYLDILQGLRVVSRAVPATESQPEKSKKGLYQIADRFLHFWFRFVHPHQALLDLRLADAVLEQRVRPAFDPFVGRVFEQAAREHVARLARAGELPFLPERLGNWWDRDDEADLLAVSDSDQAMLIGECKWWTAPVGVNVLDDLKRKAHSVDPTGRWPRRWYALFAKSGFTPDLRAAAAVEDVQLIGPELMVATRRPDLPG